MGKIFQVDCQGWRHFWSTHALYLEVIAGDRTLNKSVEELGLLVVILSSRLGEPHCLGLDTLSYCKISNMWNQGECKVYKRDVECCLFLVLANVSLFFFCYFASNVTVENDSSSVSLLYCL